MAEFYYGSINLSKLLEKAHEKHSGFMRGGEKQNVYVNITIWQNETPDKYGNVLNIQVNPAKDATDEKFYIGNCKKGESRTEQITANDLKSLPTDDDLPF